MPSRQLTPAQVGSRGYTLLELIIIMAIIGILSLFGFPALDKTIHQAKIRGYMVEGSSLVRLARAEAVKQQLPAIVKVDFANGWMEAFMDVDEDGVFTPDPMADPFTADYRVGDVHRLPGRIFIWGPADAAPLGGDAVDGLTPHPDGTSPNQLSINPTGTVEDIGAFRFGDQLGNFFEIRISPKASAKIMVRKWDPTASDWFANGENGQSWRWY